MERNNLVLAALSAHKGHAYSPVQVQKLFFLIDENIADYIGGKAFDFEPYNYGPFDKEVYSAIQELNKEDKVEYVRDAQLQLNRFKLTDQGHLEGRSILNSLNEVAKDYIVRVDRFIRETPFRELVASIYKEYPSMKVNSVFNDR